MMALRRWLRSRADREAGLTLMELVVSMGIFTIVIAVFMAGLLTMTQSTVRAQDVTEAGDSVRRAFQTMDKQIRYASSINLPGVGASGAHYVEFITTSLPDGQDPLCVQWRYDPGTERLEYRRWRDVPTGSRSAWRYIAGDVRNELSDIDQHPFWLQTAGGPRTRQQLTVRLDVGRSSPGGAEMTGADVETVFVARNSSLTSPSNLDEDGDGVSDTPVCSDHLERP